MKGQMKNYEISNKSVKANGWVVTGLTLLLLAAMAGSCLLGAADIKFDEIWHSQIFWRLRLPRVLMSVLVGAVLSVCGAAYQSIFRNPLTDPYVLGVSSGASLGAAVAILLGLEAWLWGVGGMALAAALATVWLIYVHIKSDNVELKHIIEEFNRVALTRPEVAFTLIHNGKDINVLKKAKSLKFRIQDLLGSNVADPLVELQSDTSVVKISGYVCRPDLARKTPGNQYLFVNGRYFRSPYLHKAIMNAYGEMVAEGAIPSYFIYLETDPHSIDVNIHPTKTEIKFEEDSVVFQVLYAAVREALGSNSFGASIDFSRPAEGMPVFSNRYESFRPDVFAPSVEVDADYNPFNSEGGIPASGDAPAQAPSFRHGQDYSSYVHKTDDYGKLFDDSPVSKERQLIVIQGKYIVSPSATGMMVVSARRAKERILYEKFLKVLSAGGHVSQSALFPVQLRVGAVNVPLLQDNLPLLEKCGFDISILGVDTIVVSGVPDGYSCDPGMVEAMVSDLILILSDGTSSLPGVMESSLAEKFARLGAAEADPVGSQWDAAKLLDALFACENAEFTPSGKKIISEMSVEQMEKLF